ncbi:hypothetical protein CMV_007018 [Castanea mollissima]|uniref:Uncharacterized protein n=1 Tax=Castanea mollissima TaxID=60419 RepID=A0A8J4RLQ2_9ROSI|nr:hypothetical protein CMV_007018 [Castanea mollissima]
MEGHLQNSPKQGYPAYREDENIEKCVLGLGTTLVATIEEAKHRISQIEHIFFPTFHLKSGNLQNFFPEGKKARENVCKEKENHLILRIERLQRKKQQAFEENQSLKLEWDHGNKVSDTSEAPCDTAEVNNICFNGSLGDVKEANLIQSPSCDSPTSSFLIESNSPSNVKFATFAGTKWAASCSRDTWSSQCLVEKVDELEHELRGKKQKVADGKELAQNFVKKIDWLLSETSDNLHLLREYIKDKELLVSKLECLEDKKLVESNRSCRRSVVRLRRESNYKTIYLNKLIWLTLKCQSTKRSWSSVRGASCGNYNWFRREK